MYMYKSLLFKAISKNEKERKLGGKSWFKECEKRRPYQTVDLIAIRFRLQKEMKNNTSTVHVESTSHITAV